MKVEKFYGKSLKELGLIKIAIGDANWDYYLWHNYIYSVAKDGSGASDSVFGSINYFKKYYRLYKENLIITSDWENILDKVI
jgi:hypothetical protein